MQCTPYSHPNAHHACSSSISDRKSLQYRYDSRIWGLRFSQFFQHGSTPKPYNKIMLPCDSGADESNSCNSNANFPPIQVMQLRLTSTWRCSVNYRYSNNNNKSRDHFRFLIGEVSIIVFRFRRNIDTTTTTHDTV